MATVSAIDLGVPGAKVVDLSHGAQAAVMCVLLDVVHGHSNLKCFPSYAGAATNGARKRLLGQNGATYDSLAEYPTIFLGMGRKAIRVKVGRDHACAILDNGAAKCW